MVKRKRHSLKMTHLTRLTVLIFAVFLLGFHLLQLHTQDRTVNVQTTSNAQVAVSADNHSLNCTFIDEVYPGIPNQVMFYWCAKLWSKFEFRHYLSMYSVIRLLQPDIIFFLYDNYPKLDRLEYNTWLEELRQIYPFVYLEERKRLRGCNGTIKDRLAAITEELSTRGGFYVHETTILSPTLLSLLAHKRQVIGINRISGHGFLMTQKGLRIPKIYVQDIICPDSIALSNHSSIGCVNMIESIHPKDIWELDNGFGQLARWAAYGETLVMRPIPVYTKLAPNIAHYVWLGNSSMDYAWYLSILSVLHVLKVDRVFIHGETPTGKYWDAIRRNDKVKVIYRYPETYVFDQRVFNVAHKSDVWRFDIMNKYGGLYLDVDAVFVKPLPDHLRAYDAVLNIANIYGNQTHGYPNILQNGVLLGKAGSRFWSECLKTMRKYVDRRWIWNSCYLPYKVKERYPKALLIDTRLQVECFRANCRPSWLLNDNNMASDRVMNWRTDAYSFHFTGRIPPELQQENLAVHSESMFGEIARYILDKAGLLKNK